MIEAVWDWFEHDLWLVGAVVSAAVLCVLLAFAVASLIFDE